MMFALGAAFCLFGLRFMLLRWRELDFARHRIDQAVRNAERELQRGINVHRARVDSAEVAARSNETDDSRIVQARSAPPTPLL